MPNAIATANASHNAPKADLVCSAWRRPAAAQRLAKPSAGRLS